MKALDLKLTRIGNSRGVRLPVEIIKRYGFSDPLAAEIREEGLLLRPKKQPKLSWEQTAREMAASGEDWRAWDFAASEGLETCPWHEPAPPEVQEWARTSVKRERQESKPGAKRAKK